MQTNTTLAVAYIVKKTPQQIEPYLHDKLYNSIKAASLSVRKYEGEAETTAREVCKKVEQWLESKIEVTSSDIRRKAAEALAIYNPEAAYLYKD
jgi:hypothetical protein